jgi:DNA-binding phage protein
MRKMRKYRDYLIEKLQDPVEASAYLQTALEEYQTDHDAAAFLLSLRTVAEAQGGFSTPATQTDITPQALYGELASDENLRLDTLGSILNGLGYRLSIEPLNASIHSP